ncbi:MAG: chorismate mutase [Dehalococcoidia bacterium]|nr:chorismate mutase [Dehalococcoidia bacterium]
MVVCRGLRGATTADANTKDAISSATRELLQELVKANGVSADQIAAAWLTTTRDLNAEFPATAARLMGWTSVAMLSGHEIDVPDATPMCIRVMLLVNTEKKAEELRFVYLKGATNLRNRGLPPTTAQ